MIRLPRRLAFLAAAALAAGACPPAGAQDAPRAGGGKPGDPAAAAADPVAAYEAARKPLLAQVAGRLESVATFALGNRLKQTALDLYRAVLEYDADNARARRELGFEKKGEEWVAVDAKVKKLEDYEDESEKKRPELERKLKDARVGAAKTLAELGEMADRASRPEDAQDLWKRSLDLDDQNALANERMGNKKVDGKWLTDRAIRHREFRKVYDATLAKARGLPVAVVGCDDTTGIFEKAGIAGYRRYKTKNFRIESTLPDGAIRETLITLERARQFFIDLLEVPERFVDYSLDPAVYVIGISDEQKDKLIDACDQIPAAEKSFKKKFGSVGVGTKLHIARYPDSLSAQSNVVHTATHTFGVDTFGNHGVWLKEALANAVAAAVMKSSLKVCFSGENTVAGIELAHLDLEQAAALLYDLVRKKKDTPLGEFVKLGSDALNAQHIAKSWSVLMYLLERDRPQTREYLLRAAQGNGENSRDAKVVEQYFPEFPAWKDLDEAWREWAADVYKDSK
jgi:hypothetical protein